MPKKTAGNAMSDANSGASDWQAIVAGVEAGLGISAQSGNMLAQEAQAFGPNLDKANAQLDSVAQDCMWPPSAQVTIPIIPGIYSQSFQIPCLVTYSEARAVFAIGVILTGISITAFGTAIIATVAGAGIVLKVTGVIPGGKAGAKGAAPAAAGETAAAPELALAA